MIDLAGTLRNIYNLIIAVRGGAVSIQGVVTELDTYLDLARSPQSGTTTTDGTEQDIYEEDEAHPFSLECWNSDLSNMIAGHSVRFRIYKKNISGGAYIQVSDDPTYTYTGVQSPAMADFLVRHFNMYGLKVTMELLAGANIDIVNELFDGVRP